MLNTEKYFFVTNLHFYCKYALFLHRHYLLTGIDCHLAFHDHTLSPLPYFVLVILWNALNAYYRCWTNVEIDSLQRPLYSLLSLKWLLVNFFVLLTFINLDTVIVTLTDCVRHAPTYPTKLALLNYVFFLVKMHYWTSKLTKSKLKNLPTQTNPGSSTSN